MRNLLGCITVLLLLFLVVPFLVPVGLGAFFGGSNGVVVGLMVLAGTILVFFRRR